MCPDNQVLSAYLDGEVPSPWKEQVEERLQHDEECRRRYERLRAVREMVSGDLDLDVAGSRERVWQRLQEADLEQHAIPVWRRRITLPLPAAVAAGVVLLFALALTGWQMLHHPAVNAGELAMASGKDVQLTISVEDMQVEQVLKWLDSHDMLGEVNIRLPESPHFKIIGEPTLLKVDEPDQKQKQESLPR